MQYCLHGISRQSSEEQENNEWKLVEKHYSLPRHGKSDSRVGASRGVALGALVLAMHMSGMLVDNSRVPRFFRLSWPHVFLIPRTGAGNVLASLEWDPYFVIDCLEY